MGKKSCRNDVGIRPLGLTQKGETRADDLVKSSSMKNLPLDYVLRRNPSNRHFEGLRGQELTEGG